ncbi:MAG: molybdopterin dehydrogenase [Kosmotoga sp.]|nr:MAG: molybdopterin dehydrogenase [Kosmotoga sp.]
MLLNVKAYHKPHSIEEAYNIWSDYKNEAVLVAGGTNNALMKSNIPKRLIDLKSLGLNDIKEKGNEIIVGSMIDIENFRKNEIIRNSFGDFFFKSFSDIASPQLRNMITIGGSVAAKVGWSDVVTCLLTTESRLITYGANGYQNINIDEFNHFPKDEKPIITHLILNKENYVYGFRRFTKSAFDISIVNVGIALKIESDIVKRSRFVIGSRPQLPDRFSEVEEGTENLKFDDNLPTIARNLVFEHFTGGSNHLASVEYRRHLASVLTERILTGLGGV